MGQTREFLSGKARRLAVCAVLCAQTAGAARLDQLRAARDRQDRPGLEKMITDVSAGAEKNANDARAQYDLAVANSYLAEISLEMRQRNEARSAAEAGIRAAEKAVALKPEVAEYHRILGTLCGQVIPANVMAGLRYGRCALDQVNKAVQLDPKSSDAYLSRGVGYYYLPSAFGGGVDRAVEDMEKAIELNPKSADAWMWLGVAQRKKNQFAEARKSLLKSLELNSNRVWAKQLLEKTPE